MASAPFNIKSFAASAVAILPTITSWSGNCFLRCLSILITSFECPCAVSITITSDFCSIRASALSIESILVLIAAPTSKLPNLSLEAFGNVVDFWISLKVIIPFNSFFLLVIKIFSILFSLRALITSSFV